MPTIMLPIAATWSATGGNLIAAIAVIGLAIFGWRQGLFVSALAGLQVLVSFVAALALAGAVVEMLRGMDASLPGRALAIVYLVSFTAVVIGIRLAIGRFVPEVAVPFAWPIDRGLGTLVGILAGHLLAGAVLVGWSLAMLPGPLRLDPAGLAVDPGAWVLDTFARCVEPASASRKELLHGNAGTAPWPEAPRASEPVVDVDGSGGHDSGEPFLDVDGDGSFTRSLGFHDTRGDRRRRLGLVECYRLGAWEGITVWHAPELTSDGRVRLGVRPAADEPLYQAVTRDADGPAGLVYSLRPEAAGQEPADAEASPNPLAIDPATGLVSFPAGPAETQRRAAFTVVVTDPTGLSDERDVLVTW
jgi:hypothetical protein